MAKRAATHPSILHQNTLIVSDLETVYLDNLKMIHFLSYTCIILKFYNQKRRLRLMKFFLIFFENSYLPYKRNRRTTSPTAGD